VLVLLMGNIMNYVLDMIPGGMIYVPSFMNIHSGVQELLRVDTYTHRQAKAISQSYFHFLMRKVV
jgi:hypothetical protein